MGWERGGRRAGRRGKKDVKWMVVDRGVQSCHLCADLVEGFYGAYRQYAPQKFNLLWRILGACATKPWPQGAVGHVGPVTQCSVAHG